MRFFRLQNIALALSLFGAIGLVATNLSPVVHGQTIVSGDLTGHVTDSSGAIVVGATVTLSSDADGSKRVETTNAEGVFRFSLLPPGTYTAKVSSTGLVGAATHVVVSVGKASIINIAVQPASVATEIVVDSSSQPLLQTEDANITTIVDARSIEQLPVPGGDISTLAFTAPGVNLSTGAGYGGFVAFGLPATSNLYTLNGNDIMDPFLNLNNSGASNLTLGANELSDVAIVNNGYTAQYGRYPGTQINYTTKSGSNKFHGNLQYFWNGRTMNANDWINKNTELSAAAAAGLTPAQISAANQRPFSNSNEWAASVGGPLWHDKLFFFFDTEGMRYVLPGGGGNTYIPTEAFMKDVVANVSNLNPVEAAYYQKIQTLYAGASGAAHATAVTNDAFSVDPKDPSSYSTSDCGHLDGYLGSATPAGYSSQTTVNGNAYGYTYTGSVDSGKKDADGNEIYYPTTAIAGAPCTQKFYAAVNNLNTEALWSARMDQVIGSRDHASYRMHHDWGVQATGTDPINSAFNANSVQPEWEGQFNETHTFSNTVANDLILSGLWYGAMFGPPNFGASTAVFPTTLEFGDGQGFANLGGNNYEYPNGRNVQQYQIVDDLSVLWKRHSLKFGVNVRGNKISDFRAEEEKAGLTVFNSLVDFATGEITNAGGSQVTQAFTNVGAVPIGMETFGIYAQDEWATSENLKLTLSLRVDHNANVKCLNNCFSRLTADFPEIGHDASTPYNQSIKTGLGEAFPATNAVVVQPRVGFSYAPKGQSGRYVVRGGVGMFSDLAPGTIANYFLDNAPNVLTFTYSQPAPPAAAPDARPHANGTPTVGADYSYVDPTQTSNSAYSNLKASANAFQAGFTSGQTVAEIQAAALAAGGVYKAPNFTSVVDTLKTPKYLEWNLETQVQLSRSDVMDFNYVGNYAWDTFMLSNLDNAYSPFGMAGLSTTAPDSRFGIVTDLTNNGHSNYNGLTSSLRHTAKYGLTLTANYTYSHALDLVSNGGLLPFSYEASYPVQALSPTSYSKMNYGNADYDIRQSGSLQYVWTIPYKPANAMLRTAAAGWSVSGNLYIRGGYPISITNNQIYSNQLGNSNTTTLLAGLVSGNDHSCSAKPNAAKMDAAVCFTKDTFATVPDSSAYSYGFGNLARNSFQSPHYFNSDLQLNKETKILENHTLKVGANFFNVLNHTNFAPPVNNAASGAFGEITSTVTPPSSPYGSFQGSAVSGRVVQLLTSFTF
jgi:hypothetical protein